MQNVLSKKNIGYLLGAVIALSFGAIALLSVSTASATAPATFTTDDYFGGATTDFAGSAGLGEADLVSSIANIIRIALGFLGIIAVVIILLGGFKWMTAGGNDDKLKKAKQLIFAGLIGLVIILSAYAIASFVISSITSATTSPTTTTPTTGN